MSDVGVSVSDAVKRWARDNCDVLIEKVGKVQGDDYVSGGELSVRFDRRGSPLRVFYGVSVSEGKEVCTYDIVSSVRGDIEKYPLRLMSEGSLNKIAREVFSKGDLNEKSYKAAKSLVENVPVAFALDEVRGFAEEILPGNKYYGLLRAAVFNVIRDSPYLIRDGGPMRDVAEDVLYRDELRLILDSIGTR